MLNYNQKVSPFIKVRQENRISPFEKVSQQNLQQCMTEEVQPVIPQLQQMIIPQVKQVINEIFSEYSQQNNYNGFQQGMSKIVYETNGSIGEMVVHIFYNAVQKYSGLLNYLINTDNEREFAGKIAIILTHELKIIVKHQKWLYVYNGKIYIQCASEEMLVPMVRELCEKALVNMNIVCSPALTSAIIREVLETACYIDVSDDMSRYIVFNDGILDLLEMRLKPFISGKFFTSMIMANWDSTENQCPTFMSMLNLYTRGDKVLQSRLMEAMGLCLTNDTVKRIICFQGVTNSGKSLLVSFLMRLFNNEATVSLYPNEFAERFALSKIFGKSLCVCMDMESAPLNAKATAVLKQISGNDIIGAEFKYANGNIMFRSKARVILCSNFNIVPSSDDEAFNMRKLVIPFTHRINEGVIPCEVLMNRLEAEKDAIVKMLVQAYISLKNRGYIFSGDGDWYDSYVPVNGNVSIIENEVRKFIDNKCIITGNDKDYISAFTLFNKFSQCSGNMCGYSLKNPNQFSGIVRSLYSNVGHARKRFNGSENALSCFTGIRVRDE